MASIKSAIKRNKQNGKRRLCNHVYDGAARTFVRKARTSIENGELEDARQATQKAISALDKAAEKGILHKKNVARRKSRLMKRLSALEKESAE